MKKKITEEKKKEETIMVEFRILQTEYFEFLTSDLKDLLD